MRKNSSAAGWGFLWNLYGSVRSWQACRGEGDWHFLSTFYVPRLLLRPHNSLEEVDAVSPSGSRDHRDDESPRWPLSPGLPLCPASPHSSPSSLSQAKVIQRVALRSPWRDLGSKTGRESLRKCDPGQDCSPWKNSGTGDSYCGLTLCHQCGDSYRLGGEGAGIQPYPLATEDLERQVLP